MNARVVTTVALLMLGSLIVRSVAFAADFPKGQLPDTVTPTHYAVNLTVLPEDQRFSGNVAIDVQITQDSTVIFFPRPGPGGAERPCGCRQQKDRGQI